MFVNLSPDNMNCVFQGFHKCVYNVCQLITTWSVCFKVYNSIIISHKCVYLVCQLIIWEHECSKVYHSIIATHKMFVNLSSDNMKCVLQGLQFYNHNPSMCLQCLSTYHLATWSVCFKVYNSIITSHKCVYNVCQLIIWEHEVVFQGLQLDNHKP